MPLKSLETTINSQVREAAFELLEGNLILNHGATRIGNSYFIPVETTEGVRLVEVRVIARELGATIDGQKMEFKDGNELLVALEESQRRKEVKAEAKKEETQRKKEKNIADKAKVAAKVAEVKSNTKKIEVSGKLGENIGYIADAPTIQKMIEDYEKGSEYEEAIN